MQDGACASQHIVAKEESKDKPAEEGPTPMNVDPTPMDEETMKKQIRAIQKKAEALKMTKLSMQGIAGEQPSANLTESIKQYKPEDRLFGQKASCPGERVWAQRPGRANGKRKAKMDAILETPQERSRT